MEGFASTDCSICFIDYIIKKKVEREFSQIGSFIVQSHDAGGFPTLAYKDNGSVSGGTEKRHKSQR